jgi:hypothetical protein
MGFRVPPRVLAGFPVSGSAGGSGEEAAEAGAGKRKDIECPEETEQVPVAKDPIREDAEAEERPPEGEVAEEDPVSAPVGHASVPHAEREWRISRVNPVTASRARPAENR